MANFRRLLPHGASLCCLATPCFCSAGAESKIESEARPRPFFTREEIAKHNTSQDLWVTYKEGVYDITRFVQSHPGGADKLMLAGGKAIDPFWRIYRTHLKSQLAQETLEQMRIGSLDPSEKPTEVDSSDPYGRDPAERHPGLLFHNTKPCNAELPAALQTQCHITPNELWFIRHHHPVPVLDGAAWRLGVQGECIGAISISLSLDDLRHRFPKTEVQSTIQCGGNRRAGLDTVAPTAGISWGTGAISNATWGGVLLRDVLRYVGLLTPAVAEQAGVRHVIFKGADDMEASIPIEKALSEFGDVLLAYEMNGAPLPPEHGYPLRAVVPGHVGVRNVKWVTRLVVSAEEAQGPWQRGIAYKSFPPQVKSFDGIDVSSMPSMQEMPVQSVIVHPREGQQLDLDDDDDTIEVSGWAYSGGGRGIQRVDISADGGQTWHTAELTDGSSQHPSRAWAWTFWEAQVPVPAGTKAQGTVDLCCRATDMSCNVQPERPESFWNKRGLNNTSWHHVHARVE